MFFYVLIKKTYYFQLTLSKPQFATYRLNPLVPAELELVPVDVAVLVLVKHQEHLLEPVRRHHVDVALVVPEQGPADQRELGQREPIVTGSRWKKKKNEIIKLQKR